MKKLIELIPTKYHSVYNVQLNLQEQTRYIGKVDIASEGTFLSDRKQKHIFRKTNSLGINHSLLVDESIPFKWIVIDFEGRKLVTSRLYFLTHSQCFQFGNKGFELQCFLPLELFGIQKAREFEAAQTLNLFQEVA
ncbi:MAG: hypothetical protein M0P61_14710 [Ignavibacteriaceae bacterium]|jgi:hypothetical protein|nr:hypothetical protein [Ignavibacteriaceae bacterium]